MIRKLLQVVAFFLPSPLNVWIHKISGSKLGKHVKIYPGVLLLCRRMEILDNAVIKFGTMINARSFKLGRKSSIGYFVLVNGMSDFIVDDACTIGARSMINCDRKVHFHYYSGNGPACYIYTHGSFLPVTEGYRTTFGDIEIKEKVWVQMNCKIGPGVTIGEGSVILPGTVLLENIDKNRMVVGDPGKLLNIPLLKNFSKAKDMNILAREILEKYCEWSNEYTDTKLEYTDGLVNFKKGKKSIQIGVNKNADIVILTEKGQKSNNMFFNLIDLTTDIRKHPLKSKLEFFMRLYYGLTFLE